MDVTVYLTHTFTLSCTTHCHPLKLVAVSKAMPTLYLKYLFGESFLCIQQLSSGVLFINALSVMHVTNFFAKQLKICEICKIKDPRILVLYGILFCPHTPQCNSLSVPSTVMIWGCVMCVDCYVTVYAVRW